MSSLRSAAGAGRRTLLARAAALTAATLVLAAPNPALAAAAPGDYFYAAQAQWGLNRIKILAAWDHTRGAGSTVAVIDTGADLEHADLQGSLVSGGKDYVDGDASANDNQGHGTMMAGIIAAQTDNNGVGVAAVAPGANVLPVRWISREGNALNGNPAHAAAGIRWALANAANKSKLVIVLGWDWPNGSGGIPDVKNVYARSDVQSAISEATAAGAVVVIASGNTGSGSAAYNPDDPAVIVVGATTQADGIAAGSNGGYDILAPGKDIVSTYWDETQSNPKDANGNPLPHASIYGVAEGTSLGAAHVAGVAALLLSKGTSNTDTVAKLLASGEKFGNSRIVDAAAAFDATPVAPPPPSSPTPPPDSGPTPIVVGSPTPGPSSPSASPSKTKSKSTSTANVKPSPTKTAQAPSQAPSTPASEPPVTGPAVTSDYTPNDGATKTQPDPVPLEGTATFLASGLNFVAGAIDYTGGLLKQAGTWQAIAAVGILMVAFETSRRAVRRKQTKAAAAAGQAGGEAPNDILP